jgi:hypothetical protein
VAVDTKKKAQGILTATGQDIAFARDAAASATARRGREEHLDRLFPDTVQWYEESDDDLKWTDKEVKERYDNYTCWATRYSNVLTKEEWLEAYPTTNPSILKRIAPYHRTW